MSNRTLLCFAARRSFVVAAIVLYSLAAICSPRQALAQFGGGGGGGAGGGGTPNTIGGGNTSGVAIDADGVVQRIAPDPTGRLLAMRIEQSRARLEQDLLTPSPLRKVSLSRLIRRVNQAIAEGHGPDDAMKHLAGLTRIQYLFFYPDTGDIVLAGPAEGWVEDPSGRVLGMQTGQPVLELQDLIVALRTFAPEKSERPFVYCSIDPTSEGLSRMQQFLSQVGRNIQAGDTQFIVQGLQQSLGRQTITVGGIPATTHFAQVMVEADYRMKLIGIGLEPPPVRMATFIAMANPASVARNALTRWFFVPDYQRIKVSDDDNAAEFVGAGVKLVGEDELVSADGSRSEVGAQSRASRRFTRAFTDKYHQIAAQSPVYGQLRNCVDMLVAAAFLQKHQWYAKAGLSLGAIGDESAYKIETYNAPREVATAVNAMWKGNRLMTPLGGGVEIRPSLAVEDANTIADDGSAAQARDELDLSQLPADAWWWD